MRDTIRRTTAAALIAATALFPTLSQAAEVQYFRLYGRGTSGPGGPAAPPPASTLAYLLSAPAAATVGQSYSGASTATGAVGARVFSVLSGALPAWLTLDPSTGALSGVPTVPGSFSAVLVVKDSTGASATATLNLTVAPVVMAVSGSPSGAGTVGIGYGAQFSASGGSAPYAFSTASSLPPGVTLSSSGLLSGTPSLAGDYPNIVIHAADGSGGQADSAPFSIRIAAPLSISWTPADGQVGVDYVATPPLVTGGRAPYLYSLSGQALVGLTFVAATGALVGTPAIEGTYAVGLAVLDADGRTAAAGSKTITIAPGEIVDNQGPLALSANPPTAA